MNNWKGILVVASLVGLLPGTAAAYVGPGMGLGAIAAFFGGLFAVLLAIVGVVWYPIKRLLGRGKPAAPAPGDVDKRP